MERSKTMRIARNGLILAALIVVPTLFLASEVTRTRKAVPPAGVTSFEAFVAWQPNVCEFRVIEVDGAAYVEAIGPMYGRYPSDRSSYIFGQSGRLKWWTADIGDDQYFQQNLRIYEQGRVFITLDEARDWFHTGSDGR